MDFVRDFKTTVKNIISIVPQSEVDFIQQLEKLFISSNFTAPELMYLNWEKLSDLLQAHVLPQIESDESQVFSSDWQFYILSIVSTIPIEQVIEILI